MRLLGNDRIFLAGDDLNIFESNLPQALSRQHKKDTKENGERQSQQRMGGPGAELEGHPGHVKAQQKSHRLDQAADRGDDAADICQFCSGNRFLMNPYLRILPFFDFGNSG